MNGIFTRQYWEERSLFFHTKRGTKQCKANLTVSERTEDAVPRVYKSKNKQQFVKYFAVHFSVWETKHTLRDLLEPAISSRSWPFQITRQTQSLNSKKMKIILRIMSGTFKKKTYSLIECFDGRTLSNFRHKHETVGWTWGVRVGRDPADIVDAVAMKFEFLNRASTVAVPYNRFLKNNNYYFCKHGNTSNSIDKHF